jgi:hypothetical protein
MTTIENISYAETVLEKTGEIRDIFICPTIIPKCTQWMLGSLI